MYVSHTHNKQQIKRVLEYTTKVKDLTLKSQRFSGNKSHV